MCVSLVEKCRCRQLMQPCEVADAARLCLADSLCVVKGGPERWRECADENNDDDSFVWMEW